MGNATQLTFACIATLTVMAPPVCAQGSTQPHPFIGRPVRVLVPSVFPEWRTGRLSLIDDDWIRITSDGTALTLPIAAIDTMEIGATRGEMAGKGAIVGGAIGAISGALLLGYTCIQEPAHDECIPSFYVLTAVVVAVPVAIIGAIFGAAAGESWKPVDLETMSTMVTLDPRERRIGFAIQLSL